MDLLTGGKVSAFLFDLDGTLIDTEKYYRRCWPIACAHFGYTLTDEMALQLRSLGRPFAPALMKKWFGESCDYFEIREYRKGLVAEVMEKEGIVAKPGAEELLRFLRDKGIKVSTTTATNAERTTRFLGMVGLLKYFDEICCAEHVKEGKPAPDLYAFACDKLGFPPSECIAVEDAPNGIKSAVSAGCRCIFVPDQTENEPDVEPLCVAKVKSLADIIKLM